MALGTRLTVIAVACVVYASSVVLHEAGHLAAGLAVGGQPSLISTTDVRGDWSGVSTLGMTAIGVAGSAVNVLLAALGLVLLRGVAARSWSFRLFAWLLVSVNGFVVGMYMIASPLLGFGDWATIFRPLAWQLPLRGLTLTAGCLVTACCFHIASRHVELVVGERSVGGGASASDLALTSWLAGGALAVAAALLSPLGPQWSVPIALGSTLGTTWPMLPASRGRGGRAPGDGRAPRPIEPDRAWIVAGLAAALVFVFVFGPGVELR